MKKTLLLVTLITLLLLVSSASSQTAPAISSDQRQAVEKVVRDYLLNNPEIVRDAMQALQVKEDQQKRAATAANLKKLESEIYSDVDSPVLGSEQADVSIVVFYDYFCGYCKKTLPELQAFLAKNPMVKVIYKEFPILGEASILAAKAALAAGRQGKFEAFHRAMLETNAGTDEAIKAIAERLGLDYARLHKDMNDPKTVAAIERNIRLADALNINGTPAYLIGSQVVPGAIDTAALSRMVNDERAKLANANKDKSAAKGLN